MDPSDQNNGNGDGDGVADGDGVMEMVMATLTAAPDTISFHMSEPQFCSTTLGFIAAKSVMVLKFNKDPGNDQ